MWCSHSCQSISHSHPKTIMHEDWQFLFHSVNCVMFSLPIICFQRQLIYCMWKEKDLSLPLTHTQMQAHTHIHAHMCTTAHTHTQTHTHTEVTYTNTSMHMHTSSMHSTHSSSHSNLTSPVAGLMPYFFRKGTMFLHISNTISNPDDSVSK